MVPITRLLLLLLPSPELQQPRSPAPRGTRGPSDLPALDPWVSPRWIQIPHHTGRGAAAKRRGPHHTTPHQPHHCSGGPTWAAGDDYLLRPQWRTVPGTGARTSHGLCHKSYKRSVTLPSGRCQRNGHTHNGLSKPAAPPLGATSRPCSYMMMYIHRRHTAQAGLGQPTPPYILQQPGRRRPLLVHTYIGRQVYAYTYLHPPHKNHQPAPHRAQCATTHLPSLGR